MTHDATIELTARMRARLGVDPPADAGLCLGTPSAVLVPLFVHDDGSTHVWLLRKSDALRRHGGQVALPGGKVDPLDRSLVETALREAEEEIGLSRSALEIVGQLERQPVITGYVVTPFVAVVSPGFTPVPDPGEVARVFTAPLSDFASEGSLREVSVLTFRRMVETYAVEGELVWGATAAILKRLARRVL